MSKAQINTFLNKVNQDKRLSQKHLIYRYIKRNPKTTIDNIFNDATGMLKETIVGRVSELCDLGVVKYIGEQNKSQLVTVTNPGEQIKLFNSRRKDKKLKAIKSLLNNFKLDDRTVYQLELEKSLAS